MVGGILYFNNPPQGAWVIFFEVHDTEISVTKDTNESYNVLINGTIFYKRDIYENPYNPLPLKVIIDISTNETRWIDRKLISSTEFLCNMSFNETYLFSKNIIVSDPDSYLLEISIFALQPNKFWGTHWKQVGEKSLFITIPKK